MSKILVLWRKSNFQWISGFHGIRMGLDLEFYERRGGIWLSMTGGSQGSFECNHQLQNHSHRQRSASYWYVNRCDKCTNEAKGRWQGKRRMLVDKCVGKVGNSFQIQQGHGTPSRESCDVCRFLPVFVFPACFVFACFLVVAPPALWCSSGFAVGGFVVSAGCGFVVTAFRSVQHPVDQIPVLWSRLNSELILTMSLTREEREAALRKLERIDALELALQYFVEDEVRQYCFELEASILCFICWFNTLPIQSLCFCFV